MTELLHGLTPQEVRQVLAHSQRSGLHAYLRGIHPVVNSSPFIETSHLRAICWQLERLLKGDIQRLLVALPPRWFKSSACSVALPTWALGHDPSLKIVCASYGADLSGMFAQQSRSVMLSETYRRLFPQTQLATTKPPWDNLSTTANGYRRSVSVGGPLTGKGVDLLVVDDPMKAEEAASLVSREGAYNWFKGTAMSRIDNRATGRVVVLMQRLHMDDLVGRLLAEEGWTYLCLPAVASRDMEIDVSATRYWDIKAGDHLFPERFNEAVLKQTRADLGEDAYNAQFLQAPAPAGGALIKLKWFPRYEKLPQAWKWERVIQVWDTALVDSKSADYSVGLTFVVHGKSLYLIDVLRRRMPYPELEKAVVAYREKHQAHTVVVEQAGTGIVLLQNLRTLKGHEWLVGKKAKLSKAERVSQQVGKMERRRVLLPQAAPYLEAFLNELAEFPHGRHDDQVDALAHFLNVFDYGKNVHVGELSMFAGWMPGESVL